ncbi:DUF2357 domain-containing protein [Oligella urethralis]|uniref:Protein of uncharacterized function (DUF524) n=1 Tax=Oligella urethralis TaxID=90245 RepID=A0A2X1UNH0_9BURK|nr:DUF2357 domain-containing protein [Oligella urethralis]SPY08608.1 Protein of uncharacterised function (DUF524) [Oligella urethralis]
MQFEVRGLDIEWDESQRLVSIKKSHLPHQVYGDSGVFAVETVTFPKVAHFIGFRILNEKILHTPFFILGDLKEELIQLKDPLSNEIWWIQKGVWQKQYNKFVPESYRTAGRLELIIQDQRLIIQNNTNNFTVEELERFLALFKNNLWEIILNTNSVISANVEKNVPNVFNADVLECIDRVIHAAQKICKEPKFFLKEKQGLAPRNKVKPVARTFRELTTKKNLKLVSSRKHFTSFDTPENRYIHYCIDRLFFLINKMMERSEALVEQCNKLSNKYTDDSEKLKRIKNKKIDKEVFDAEIAEKRKKIESINGQLAEALSDASVENIYEDEYSYYSNSYEKQTLRNSKYGTFQLTINSIYSGTKNSFFCNQINGENVHIKLKNYPEKYLVIVYPTAIFNILKKLEKSSLEIEISGYFNAGVKISKKNGTKYYEYYWTRIDSIKLNTDFFRQLEEQRQIYEESNWSVELKESEKKELLQEAKSFAFRAQEYRKGAKNYLGIYEKTKQQFHKLRELKFAFKSLNIRKNNHYPNTMVFVQNPDYSAVRSNFKKFQELSNLTTSHLEDMIIVEQLGLINVSILYERWVLLQIIKVLTESFRLKMEHGWKDKLISSILNKQYNIDFKTHIASSKLDIILSYEKELPNGRRPDFILDIVQTIPEVPNTKKGEVNLDSWFNDEDLSIKPLYHAIDCTKGNKAKLISSRLVMDAKFYDDSHEQYLKDTLDKLYISKDYSEKERNKVFIIHPSRNAITERTSPFRWNVNCDYGHVSPNKHKKGHIFLIPSEKYSSMDNLKRLIVMHLQDALSIRYKQVPNNDYIKGFFCVHCGNTEEEKLSFTHGKTIGDGDKWQIRCLSCDGVFWQNFCFNCQTRLFKNGFLWTYHRTYAEQMSNCRCPKCDADLYDLQR